MLKDIRPLVVIVYGDSLLVPRQASREDKCEYESLVQYYILANKLLNLFSDFFVVFSMRGNDMEANDLA